MVKTTARKQPSSVSSVQSGVPLLWRLLVEQYPHCPRSLSRRLWQTFAQRATTAQVYALWQATAGQGQGDPVRIQTMSAALTVLSPRALMSLTESLRPSSEKPRRLGLIALQERVLASTGATGDWL